MLAENEGWEPAMERPVPDPLIGETPWRANVNWMPVSANVFDVVPTLLKLVGERPSASLTGESFAHRIEGALAR